MENFFSDNNEYLNMNDDRPVLPRQQLQEDSALKPKQLSGFLGSLKAGMSFLLYTLRAKC